MSCFECGPGSEGAGELKGLRRRVKYSDLEKGLYSASKLARSFKEHFGSKSDPNKLNVI